MDNESLHIQCLQIVDNTEEQIKPRYSMQIGQSETSIH